jgi:hypothetical protein
MDLTTVKTWAKDNPWLAGGIALGAVGIIALVVSPAARKAVGLGKAPARRRKASRKKEVSVKRLK